jgi:hypothetical protein
VLTPISSSGRFGRGFENPGWFADDFSGGYRDSAAAATKRGGISEESAENAERFRGNAF